MKIKSFSKDIIREIKTSFGRFMSIFAIVALGCGFFAGIKATCPDMKESAQAYFNEHNLMDIKLVSTYGVTRSDCEAVNRLEIVSGVMPAYSKDVLYNFDEDSVVLRLFSYNSALAQGSPYNISTPYVRDGRLPENSGECAIEMHDMSAGDFEIGDTITITAPNGENVFDSLKTDTFTIVGVINQPLYIGYNRDTTTVGSGKVNTNVIISEVDFSLEYYTEMYVTIDGADELDPFSEEYNNKIDEAVKIVSEVFEESVSERYSKLVSDANNDISSGEEQLVAFEQILSADLDTLTAMKTQAEADIAELNAQYNVAVENDSNVKNLIRSKLLQSNRSLESLNTVIYARTVGDNEIIDNLNTELDSLRLELETAKSALSQLEEPVFYNSARNANTDYSSFKSDSERIDAIAQVFPVFFIIVAALVCLTTMTRMVEEQRTQIGTCKALGYSSGKIISKYLIYAISATVLGGFAGMAIGFKAFPKIIFSCYQLLYNLPEISAPFKWDYALACIAVATIAVSVAVVFACVNEMRSVPSALMRPKSPKAGKRVLLERFPLLWKHLSFLAKVTVRNLFRYKKRFLMTIVGVAGCTALIMTGIGLKHSIASIGDAQFEEIFVYDGVAMLENTDNETRVGAEKSLEEITDITEFLFVEQQATDVTSNGNRVNAVNFIVPEDPEKLDSFVKLKDGSRKLTLDNNGVIITEKMSILLDVKVGDKITVTIAGEFPQTLEISGIAECYALHYIFITPQLFEQVFERDSVFNSTLVNTTETVNKALVSEQLISTDEILAFTFAGDTAKSFNDMIKSLDAIVIVLIICAGALAFVVLYNLGNINVTERIREIATIKVLGFYDSETSAYIYRESFLSATIGIAVGWVLGIFLHRFVVVTAEVDLVMFARDLKLSAYLFSAVMTLAFTALVNVVMHFKLKRVSMVESLKSIE